MAEEKLFMEVTVKELLPIFTIKDNLQAERIELLKCLEHDFDLIVGKELYKVGQKLIYILPDSNLKEGNEYLDDYIKPTDNLGNPLSSKLGSNNRIKSIGFNFHTKDNVKLYSNGIVCPINVDVNNFVYKYEEPENIKNNKNGKESSKSFPVGFYKTDETNYKLISNKLEFPIHLVGTRKRDGSSISIYATFNGKKGICSRNLEKPLTLKVVDNIQYNLLGKLMSYFKLKPYKWTTKLIYKEIESTSEFVTYGRPVLEKLKTAIHYLNNDWKLDCEGFCLRGEVFGKTMKGSGNKNNLDSAVETTIEIFGIDAIINGKTEKLSYAKLDTLSQYGFDIVPVYFNQVFNSKEELETLCEEIVLREKCEGIVIRNLDSTISMKFMSNQYDAKK